MTEAKRTPIIPVGVLSRAESVLLPSPRVPTFDENSGAFEVDERILSLTIEHTFDCWGPNRAVTPGCYDVLSGQGGHADN